MWLVLQEAAGQNLTAAFAKEYPMQLRLRTMTMIGIEEILQEIHGNISVNLHTCHGESMKMLTESQRLCHPSIRSNAEG